eukprot:1568383-Pyramimonas_sp.AAC.1
MEVTRTPCCHFHHMHTSARGWESKNFKQVAHSAVQHRVTLACTGGREVSRITSLRYAYDVSPQLRSRLSSSNRKLIQYGRQNYGSSHATAHALRATLSAQTSSGIGATLSETDEEDALQQPPNSSPTILRYQDFKIAIIV